jgi:uncharacterized membrane protein YhaH (DUF805 family)
VGLFLNCKVDRKVNSVYNVNMIWLIENYFRVLFKNNTFIGRANRSEYWGFVLVNWSFEFLVWIFNGGRVITISTVGDMNFSILNFSILPIMLIFSIIFWFAEWTVKVRRLHDTGTSGWFILVEIIPILGPIIMFFALTEKSEDGLNRYGKAVN